MKEVSIIMRRLTLSLLLGLALCSICLLTLHFAPAARADDGLVVKHQFDLFVVSARTSEGWTDVATLGYDKFLSRQDIDLSALSLPAPVTIRVSHWGDTAAHVDEVLLDEQPPASISGQSEDSALALKKLARRDNDVIDARGKSLTLTFGEPGDSAVLSLVARVEPEQIPDTPFRFPSDNLGTTMSSSSVFYTYVLGSQPGSLSIDGDLAGEALGEPFFEEFCSPTSGHPANDTYGWVRNDEEYLYVAIDFAPDNTRDGDKDYAAVYVDTPAGVRRFAVSVPERKWGSPGFTYTDSAVYQHKVYEFQIALEELGLDGAAAGHPLAVAFEAYGTALPDFSASKSNNVESVATKGIPFTWTVTVSSTVLGAQQSASRTTVLSDVLPMGDISYGPVSVISRGVSSDPPTLTQALSCTIDVNDVLICRVTDSGRLYWDAGGAIDVSFTATASVPGTFRNPRVASGCMANPKKEIDEHGVYANNYCTDTVTVRDSGWAVGGYTSAASVGWPSWVEPALLAAVLVWLLATGMVVTGKS